MKPFRDFPIQQKLLVMTLLICGAVLLVAVAALFTFQVLNFRSNFRRDTATLAAIVANNSTASLAFQDRKAGAEAIRSLKAKPTVLSACLVLPNGSSFAHYGAYEDRQTLSHFPPPKEFRFVGGDLLYNQPVELTGERLGTLYLRLDFRRTFLELLGFYGLVVLGVMVVSVSLAVFLSGRLRRVITEPIRVLDEAAHVVGEKKDYSVRAVVGGRGDELGRLAESFNEMLSRIQSQDAALNLSQQKLEALIHSIDGIVWECLPNTFQFTFVSRQAERLLGYAPEEWLDRPGFWREKLHPDDAAKVLQSWQDNVARRLPFNGEFRMRAADGRTVWIRESVSMIVENDRPVAIRGIFQDITEQKRAEEELEKLNRKLLETSRFAGMAEVATGVLHNVGNVLNSVSVSATLVSDRLRRSNVANLRRAAALLREQNGRLAEFLTADPKGRLLPEYFGTVADQLAGEQTELIGEIGSVCEHIEHIKEIVAMQQSYAKVSGAYESLSAVELAEDALRINSAAFDRHRIQVVREYEENTPPVCVDRHKVLQILINLLRNAKYAMDQQHSHDRRLVVRVGPVSPDRVKIAVGDNGIGIAPENLVKIFNHGFTTKKDGHGFGLHSGANAAKAMGGRITAHSEGVGKGAEFTLELPVATPARKEASALAGAKI
jgi:PAS domain S-box-containing protein